MATDPGWTGAPCAALIIDSDGVVRAGNTLANNDFPAAQVGSLVTDALPWLADAHAAQEAPPTPAPRQPADGVLAVDTAGPGVGGGGADVVRAWVGGRSVVARPVPHGDGLVTWWLVDDTDTRQAHQDLLVERGRGAFLGRVSTALLTPLHPHRCGELIAELAAGELADAALVVTRVAGRRLEATSCVRGGTPRRSRLPTDADEVPGLTEALRGLPPEPAYWDLRTMPDALVPDELGEPGAVLITPLPGHGEITGALILLRSRQGQAFSTDEERFARLFATRCGTALSSARMFQRQVAITETLMHELLPPTPHLEAGIEFAGRYRPSRDTELIGGDFYDVHPATDDDPGETLAVLGDVCGKGLEAAVLTGKIRNALQVLQPLAADHLRMLTLLNDALINGNHSRFVTLVLASARRHGGTVRLRVTSAGHPPPYVVRADGSVDEVPTHGCLVGVLPRMTAVTAEVALGPGETCLLYSDGITEARGGPMGNELFGEGRLRRVLGECAGMPADAVAERVQMVASEWVGRAAHDDMAVLAITAPRGHYLSAVGGHGPGRYTA